MTLPIKESLLLFTLIIFIYALTSINRNKLTIVEGADDNIKVMVYNNRNKREAAKLLEEVIKRMLKLRNNLEKEKAKYPEYEEYIILLVDNFTSERTSIYETDPKSDLTSYSVNKGEEISFCLKSKKNGSFHKINLLMYVAIHEMAHIACPEIGHGELFKKIFRFLILRAIELGLYLKDDYSANPVEYCGMVLSSSIV
jgi:predicted metal-dependent hydrolase